MLHPPARSGHGHHAEGDGAPLLLPGQEGDGVRGTSAHFDDLGEWGLGL